MFRGGSFAAKPTVTQTLFSQEDLAFLQERGSALADVEAQLAHYDHPPKPASLLRACTAGDGVVALDEGEVAELSALWERSANTLDIAKFVPASGAASRMFGSLLALLSDGVSTVQDLKTRAAGGDARASDCLSLVEQLDDLALRDLLSLELEGRGRSLAEATVREILEAILYEEGLGYASKPKGLLAFHRIGGEVRTPVHEHLFEACAYASGQGDRTHLHFTVSPEHRQGFEQLVRQLLPAFEAEFVTHLRVTFSEQHAATDTLAVTPEGEPFRDENGQLLFRPGGHGALIENLGALDADVVFVKNIDNVLPAVRAKEAMRWKKVLAGLLIQVRDESFALLRALEQGRANALEDACTFLARRFGASPPDGADQASWACSRLARPLRVCGMVRNEGEPGGGPFWVENPGLPGGAVQIVESSQVDLDAPDQRAVFEAATHFNPVDLVCAFRRPDGSSYNLDAFVDQQAVFIADKTHGGRPLKSLELPGLWNGAMAEWNSIFVEVPSLTFNPVKTLSDLLRPAHRP